MFSSRTNLYSTCNSSRHSLPDHPSSYFKPMPVRLPPQELAGCSFPLPGGWITHRRYKPAATILSSPIYANNRIKTRRRRCPLPQLYPPHPPREKLILRSQLACRPVLRPLPALQSQFLRAAPAVSAALSTAEAFVMDKASVWFGRNTSVTASSFSNPSHCPDGS